MQRKEEFKVRKSEVMDALLWLEANNPYSQQIEIDFEASFHNTESLSIYMKSSRKNKRNLQMNPFNELAG